ncbi:MAG: hypothetical protein ABF449_13105 [Ethanoligenens sp.]
METILNNQEESALKEIFKNLQMLNLSELRDINIFVQAYVFAVKQSMVGYPRERS